MTDLEVYQPAAQLEQYQARMIMTPEDARALDDQVRACTKAVLREGVDYGTVPGTGDRKVLLKPGAEKLLQWFGFGFTCDRTDLEVGEDGQKQGVTYRCTVTRRLPDGGTVAVTTCEGYAGYDEDKFYQPAEQARFKAEARERKWAEHDGRPANPNKWKHITDYRAPWNTVIKMAQKRAIVGAAIVATAAAGLFGQEEDGSPPADDGSTWYEQALEAALSFSDRAAGDKLYIEAAHAFRDGLCTGRQKDHIQNRVRQRLERIKTARPVDVEDLARQAAHAPAEPAASEDRAGRVPPEDQPGSATPAQLTKLHTVFTKLGFNGEDREHKLVIAETITGRAPLDGPAEGRSSKNLTLTEARKLIDTLDGFADRDALIAYMTERRQDGGSDG